MYVLYIGTTDSSDLKKTAKERERVRGRHKYSTGRQTCPNTTDHTEEEEIERARERAVETSSMRRNLYQPIEQFKTVLIYRQEHLRMLRTLWTGVFSNSSSNGFQLTIVREGESSDHDTPAESREKQRNRKT